MAKLRKNKSLILEGNIWTSLILKITDVPVTHMFLFLGYPNFETLRKLEFLLIALPHSTLKHQYLGANPIFQSHYPPITDPLDSLFFFSHVRRVLVTIAKQKLLEMPGSHFHLRKALYTMKVELKWNTNRSYFPSAIFLLNYKSSHVRNIKMLFSCPDMVHETF